MTYNPKFNPGGHGPLRLLTLEERQRMLDETGEYCIREHDRKMRETLRKGKPFTDRTGPYGTVIIFPPIVALQKR